MTPPSGREPARPQTSSAAAQQPRLSREAVVAFVLLPVLLAAGFFLGTSLLGGDGDTSIDAAATATQTPDTEAPVQGPGATGEEAPPVAGPAVPSEQQPAEASPQEAPPSPEAAKPSPEAIQPSPEEAPPSPEAAKPSPEAIQPSPEAAQPQETQPEEPQPEATQPEATQPEATQPGPEAAQPAPAPSEPAAPQDSTAVSQAAPTPAAGDNVLLFPGFAGEDVRTWQTQMAERGWIIQVDGIYGPQTQSVAARFQAEKGLNVDGLVGINTWNASWDAPVTRS